MLKQDLIFDGNEKQIFSTSDPDKVIVHFNDMLLAYNSIKRARFHGKGEINNKISALVLGYLNSKGIDTHFIELTGDCEQLCRKIDIIPLEVIVRNRIAGSLAERLGVENGLKQANTIVDLRYNNDELDDPLINEHHAVALGLVSYDELRGMYDTALKINDLLQVLFAKAGIELVDMKLEFGRATDTGEIILSDEISPDTTRLWDLSTGEILDKDRYRLDLSDVVASYKVVYDRLQAVMNNCD